MLRQIVSVLRQGGKRGHRAGLHKTGMLSVWSDQSQWRTPRAHGTVSGVSFSPAAGGALGSWGGLRGYRGGSADHVHAIKNELGWVAIAVSTGNGFRPLDLLVDGHRLANK